MFSSNIVNYFGMNFINTFNEILSESEITNKFFFMHGTATKEEAEEICKKGLETDYPELFYTADCIERKDKLLYDKLKSWPHWDRKYLIMILVSKQTGKGGIPIWEESKDSIFRLSPIFIKGYLDINKKEIILNPRYNIKDGENVLIEDNSYKVNTGELIRVSLPPDESQFWEEEMNRDN